MKNKYDPDNSDEYKIIDRGYYDEQQPTILFPVVTLVAVLIIMWVFVTK